MVLGALPFACVMVCARLPDSTQLKKIQDALWGAMKGAVAFGITIDVPTLFESLCSLWPGTGECIPPTAIFTDLLFKIAVRSDRLCILVAGLLDAFVTAYNLRRTNRGVGLNFKELRYGRIKNDDRRASGLGAHLLDYVLWVSPGMSQT